MEVSFHPKIPKYFTTGIVTLQRVTVWWLALGFHGRVIKSPTDFFHHLHKLHKTKEQPCTEIWEKLSRPVSLITTSQ